jgi:uncharacterized membrane protein YfcA
MPELLSIISTYWHIIILFFGIALLYSSAGFGGGSSYLAILALSGLAYTEIRATSLLCNIIVVTGGTYLFHQNNLIDWKKILPLILVSMPMALMGGWLKISEGLFFALLGISLLLAAVLMLISKRNNSEQEIEKQIHFNRNILFGSSIGFLSGIVGIGGGIFLAPLLHLTNWGNSKKIAATASVFILLNSIFGLIGQMLNHSFSINYALISVLLISVFLGGQIGSRLSANLMSQIWIKRITAVLIAFVGLRILWNL